MIPFRVLQEIPYPKKGGRKPDFRVKYIIGKNGLSVIAGLKLC